MEVNILKNYDPIDLQELMGISENLSLLNWERYKSWRLPFDPESSRQAAFTFMGDTYVGLGSHSLSNVELKFSQDNTRILSGLYGILRPMDLIMPYRLEMGTKLKIESGTYILGEQVSLFEREFAEYLEINYAICCASGTDALVLALKALNIGSDQIWLMCRIIIISLA